MYEQIQKIFRILKENNFECFIAGGAVRDIVMGIEPSDYDFATNALPHETTDIFTSKGYKVIPTGIEHGTVTTIIDNISFEITTYRKDKFCDGRHCEVEFTSSLEEDIKRRDLTVNALAMDEDNNIIDLVDGIGDIQRRLIKAVGDPDQRFMEDHLRIIRAIRFYTKLNFDMDLHTYESIKRLYPNLNKISRERIRDEFSEIILSPNRIRGLLKLYDSNIIDIIIPDFSLLSNIEQPKEFHPEGDALTHTMLVIAKIEEGNSLYFILAVLLHDYGKLFTYAFDIEKERITFNEHDVIGAERSKQILFDLKYDNDTIHKVYYIISNHMKFHQKMNKSTLKRMMLTKTDGLYAYNPIFDDSLKLYKYEIEASLKEKIKDIEHYDELIIRIEQIKEELKEELKRQSLKRLVTGYDIMEFGIKPGPIIAEIMEKIETAQLEGIIKTREEALAYVEDIII